MDSVQPTTKVGCACVDPGAQPEVGCAGVDPGAQPEVGCAGVDPRAQPEVGCAGVDPRAQPEVGCACVDPGAQPQVGVQAARIFLRYVILGTSRLWTLVALARLWRYLHFGRPIAALSRVGVLLGA